MPSKTPRLRARLPAPDAPDDSDALLGSFLDYVSEHGIELYPAQEEAILELIAGKNVILNTPTGSGKSLVATALHFFSTAWGARSFYTCPIKALVSEKFFALCEEFGAENVGMMTGDATVNRDAPIICCTAEILANMALREGNSAPVDAVIMDEFHYYSDRERGVAWQIPLLALPRAQFLLMSATLGDTSFFQREITALTGHDTALVQSRDRPVPLEFEYRETPLHETVKSLVETGRAPIYIVSFTQRGCAEEAQNLMSIDYCTKDEKKAIATSIEGTKFDSPYGKDVQKFIRHGIGLHHAGLLPKYRRAVEKLAQKGQLKIICGTDTLGVGINVPIRTVLFTKLCKYTGEKTAILSVRDFHQIGGRAGRRGYDDRGTVVAQAPEHVIENLRLEAKAGSDPVKRRKIVRRKPPERGYVHWDKSIFDRLIESSPEALKSQFKVSHGMLLNVLSRDGDGCGAMKRLIRTSHDSPVQRKQNSKLGRAMFGSLVRANIIEFVPINERSVNGPKLRLHTDLQDDFSLNHALSLYLLDTLNRLDPELGTYPLDVLTLVESILENPDLILQKQLDALKTEKMAEMKAAGIEYDERIAELEKLEYPKPNRDFSYDTFNAFEAKHPWVGHENIRPKSIARDMYERYMSFSEYIREYDLQRAEGLLLRYLSDVYKTLVQSVPDSAKSDDVFEMEAYFADVVRRVDSSLIDEWERMRNPNWAPTLTIDTGDRVHPKVGGIADDEKQFTVLIRNQLFRLMRALACRDYVTAAEIAADASGDASGDNRDSDITPAWFESAMSEYYADHSAICVDVTARSPANTQIDRTNGELWKVSQVIVDPDGDNDWVIDLLIDVAASNAAGSLVMRMTGVRR